MARSKLKGGKQNFNVGILFCVAYSKTLFFLFLSFEDTKTERTNEHDE